MVPETLGLIVTILLAAALLLVVIVAAGWLIPLIKVTLLIAFIYVSLIFWYDGMG